MRFHVRRVDSVALFVLGVSLAAAGQVAPLGGNEPARLRAIAA
jgi:hypothetical protein